MVKKYEPETYKGIRKSMDDFADQYAEWKITKLKEKKHSKKIKRND